MCLSRGPVLAHTPALCNSVHLFLLNNESQLEAMLMFLGH